MTHGLVRGFDWCSLLGHDCVCGRFLVPPHWPAVRPLLDPARAFLLDPRVSICGGGGASFCFCCSCRLFIFAFLDLIVLSLSLLAIFPFDFSVCCHYYWLCHRWIGFFRASDYLSKSLHVSSY